MSLFYLSKSISFILSNTFFNHGHNILRLCDILPGLTHQKENKLWLLVIKMVYTCCLKSCQKTDDLGSWKLENIQNISRLHGIIA